MTFDFAKYLVRIVTNCLFNIRIVPFLYGDLVLRLYLVAHITYFAKYEIDSVR